VDAPMRVLLVTDLTTPSQLGGYDALEMVATLTASEFTEIKARQIAPDIIVATLREPIPSVLREFALLDGLDGLPVIYIDHSNNQKATIPHLAAAAGVTSFVPTGQSPIDVMTLLEWTRLRFNTLQATRKTLADTEKKLADRISAI
jgi:AmiR/NasT family two-component response regulator